MESAEDSSLSDREKAVVQFASGLIESPADVSSQVIERLRPYFSEGEILEIAFYAMYMNLHHCYLTAFQKEPPDGEKIVVFQGPGSSIHWSTAGSFQPGAGKAAVATRLRASGLPNISRMTGGTLPELFGQMAGSIADTYFELSRNVWTTGTLELGLKELLRLKSARLARADYAMHSRFTEAAALGIDERKIGMIEDPDRAPLPEREMLALQFAELLVTTPASITDSFFAEMKLHFTEAELVELCYFTLTQKIFHHVSAAVGVQAPRNGLLTKSIQTPW